MSLLSFIIPVYNKDHILEKCIKSLLDQSLTDWEVVFVLDGSQPKAKAIISRMMKKKPNHYRIIETSNVEFSHNGNGNLATPRGAPFARNYGFSNSKGDYIVFWDADCIIEPHAAKAWVDIFDNKPEVGFIYSGYKFLNEKGAINSEPFDPWLLKIRNYISGCFPLRRKFVGEWNTDLKSLQDWDFWLSVVEKGAIGKFMDGYAFSTEFPNEKSISGQGCTPDVWLERVDAVKKLHGLSDRDFCVTSLDYKLDAIGLAKLIDADYQDFPNLKPHRYKKIIQVGFSMKPDRVEASASNFGNQKAKNYLFWMPDNIHEIWNEVSFNALYKYSILLNNVCLQFVEDKTAKDLMAKAGFKTSILPMPMKNDLELKPLPEKPRFAVDIDSGYGKVFSILDKSLPDISLELLDRNQNINDFTGIVHFFGDKTLSNGIKRMILTGRHVISNVQDPFTGFIDDNQSPEDFIANFVDKIREVSKKPLNLAAKSYYENELNPEKFVEALK